MQQAAMMPLLSVKESGRALTVVKSKLEPNHQARAAVLSLASANY
jgi:hypothetical protein